LLWVIYGLAIHSAPVVVANLIVGIAAIYTYYRAALGKNTTGTEMTAGHKDKLRPILFVTRRLPEAVEARITHDCDARFNANDRLYTRDELVAKSDGADALLITQQDPMDADLASRLPKSVRIIATLSVGFDPIDTVQSTSSATCSKKAAPAPVSGPLKIS
jgi:hypothetical protein